MRLSNSFGSSPLDPDSRKLVSARDYLEGLGRQVIIPAQKHGELLRAQLVFVTKGVFDSRLRRHLAAGAVQMHRAVVQELTPRLPQSLPASEIDAIARIAEMALDGLMIALLMRKGSKELAETKRAWAEFVDLLLARAGAG